MTSLVRIAAILGFAGVTLGAFGAHGLRDRMSPAMLEVYRTGVLYHLIHALAALGVALAARQITRAPLVVTLFTMGVVVFSGSLYILALTGITGFGAVTPVGGICLLAAWALLAFSHRRPVT